MSWIDKTGPSNDIILSSRVRMARNLRDTPFPSAMDELETDTVKERVRKSISGADSPFKEDYQFLDMKDLPPVERGVLVEKHMASPDLIKTPELSAILVEKSELCSIMINEEDHIRIQCIHPGSNLQKALDYLNEVDDVLDSQLPYAFHEDLGYLSCCPTNLGTGIRASVMMHLPALSASKQIKGILTTLPKIGFAVRGFYGEGSDAGGHIFQISNQITLGVSEEEIIASLEAVALQLMDKERQARQSIMSRDRTAFKDRVWRAYGTMLYAKVMGVEEFMKLLSQVRLGIEMGIITNIDISSLNQLMIMGQPSHVKKYAQEHGDIRNVDVLRTEIISQMLLK